MEIHFTIRNSFRSVRTYSAEAYGSAFLRRETFNSYCLGQLLDCKKSVLVGFLLSKCMSACVLTHCPSILVGLSWLPLEPF
jgi:hypothetical protein